MSVWMRNSFGDLFQNRHVDNYWGVALVLYTNVFLRIQALIWSMLAIWEMYETKVTTCDIFAFIICYYRGSEYHISDASFCIMLHHHTNKYTRYTITLFISENISFNSRSIVILRMENSLKCGLSE